MSAVEADSSIAIIGTGSIAMRHFNVLRGMGFSDVVLHTNSRERALELEGAGIPVRLRREHLLPAFLTVICTPTENHLGDIAQAQSSSEIVLVEKPLFGLDSSIGDLPVGEIVRSNTFVSLPLRFTEGARFLAGLLQHSDQERPTHVYAESRSWLPYWRPGRDFRNGYWARQPGGGVVFEVIHEIDLLWQFFGPLVPKWSETSPGSPFGFEVATWCDATFGFGDGHIASLHLDFATREASRFMSFDFDRANFRWDLLSSEVHVKKDGKVERIFFEGDTVRNNAFERQYRALLFERRRGLARALDFLPVNFLARDLSVVKDS